MRAALGQASMAKTLGEVPIGAVIVVDHQIIGKGYNQTERLQDVTAHAEIQALTAACIYLGSKYLKEATLYVTLEPCVMCSGALYWAQLGRLVYGARDLARGGVQRPALLHPKTIRQSGVMQQECQQMLQDFFREKRG